MVTFIGLILAFLLAGDDMFTDAYPMKLLDGVVYEVEGKIVSEKQGIDGALIGANASAEGGDEECVDGVTTGVDIVLASNLHEVTCDFKDIKAIYMKSLKEWAAKYEDKSECETFKKNALAYLKKMTDLKKDWQFFVGDHWEFNAPVGLLNYREDGVTPYMWFWKDGLITEKVVSIDCSFSLQ